MLFSNIFDPKLIDYQAEHDGVPFVAPYVRGSGGFVAALIFQECADLVVGEAYRLREYVNALADIEVYPAIGEKIGEVILIYKLLGDTGESDLSIFVPFKQGTYIIFLPSKQSNLAQRR